jgi:phosphoglycolate phosphatase
MIVPSSPKSQIQANPENDREKVDISSNPYLGLFLSGLPTAVLFDWDNTLVDTWEGIVKALNNTLIKFDHKPWDAAAAKVNIQRSGRDAFPKLFGEKAAEAQNCFHEQINNDRQNLKAMDDAEALLHCIQAKHIPMGVISNKSSLFLHKDIAHMGWKKYFKVIVGAGDALRDKPEPDPILLALEKLNISEPEKVWMIGDMPVDWDCALAANCLPIAIGDTLTSARHIKWSFKNCADIKKLFEKI